MSCPFARPEFAQYKGDATTIMATLPDVLDEATLSVVQATAPVVAANIETITSTFYPYMFETHPCTKNYFNLAHQVKTVEGGSKAAQPFALAHAILRYVGHLNDPEGMKRAIELAAQKHCALQVRAEHYPIVYECFMWAVGQVLGEAVTPEIADAWGKVVLYIARAMIDRELEIYEQNQARNFGWFGWKEFVVTGKRRDTDLIYTFLFAPSDGSRLPLFEAGQYVTLKLDNIPGASAETTLRHYSVSTPPGEDAFSISVQIVGSTEGEDVPAGLVSNYLRNHVDVGSKFEVSMPFGTMKLKPTIDRKPTVFIAGGIGCTVAVSMLMHVLQEREFSKVYFAHSVRNGAVHSYRNRIVRLRNDHSKSMKSIFCYSHPRPVDIKGVDYDIEGHLNLNILEEWMGTEEIMNSNYILCGPEGLVHDVVQELVNKGIQKDCIQFECFGPLTKNLNEFV